MVRQIGKHMGWRLLVASLGGAGALALAWPVFADERHDHEAGTLAFTSGPVLWGLASLGGVLLAIVLSRAALAYAHARRGRPDSSPTLASVISR